MSWLTIDTRTAYDNAWIRVREDRVIRPDGASGTYGVVEMRHPAVFVVALDDADRVLLVTVDRYTTGPGSLEVPAGGTDGEDPQTAARRELFEETGLVAREWTPLGEMDALNGIARAPEHVFLARGFADGDVATASDSQVQEGISDVRWVPFADVLDLIATGAIRDGETIAALALAGIQMRRFC